MRWLRWFLLGFAALLLSWGLVVSPPAPIHAADAVPCHLETCRPVTPTPTPIPHD